jgi:transcription elongation factor Elf1
MAELFSGERIEFNCSKCGKKTFKTLSWLEHNHNFVCAFCGNSGHLATSEFLKHIRAARDEIKRVLRDI